MNKDPWVTVSTNEEMLPTALFQLETEGYIPQFVCFSGVVPMKNELSGKTKLRKDFTIIAKLSQPIQN